MNIFEYLDLMLFGPTLDFVASCAGSVEDAVGRLQAAVIPRFSFANIVGTGLTGTVRADHVCVRWKTALNANSIRPSFRGSFVSDAGGVRLVGRIGVPAVQKLALLALSILVPAMLASFVYAGTLPKAVWLVVPAEFIFLVIVLIVFRGLHQHDYRLIADALDQALS